MSFRFSILDSRLLAMLAAAAGAVAMTPPLPLPLAPKPKTVTVAWDWPDVRFQVWSSTNLTDWTHLTDVVCAVELRVPVDKAAEYFKVRAVDPKTGAASDWGTR